MIEKCSSSLWLNAKLLYAAQKIVCASMGTAGASSGWGQNLPAHARAAQHYEGIDGML